MIYADLPNKTLLRPDEVANFLQISRFSVYRLYECGEIDGLKAGKPLRIFRDSVITFVKRQKEKSFV